MRGCNAAQTWHTSGGAVRQKELREHVRRLQRTKGFDACNECSSPKKSVRAARNQYSVRSLAYCSNVESSGFGAVAAAASAASRRSDETHRFQVAGFHGLDRNPSEAVEKRPRQAFASTSLFVSLFGGRRPS
jgi:hypothetical protein